MFVVIDPCGVSEKSQADQVFKFLPLMFIVIDPCGVSEKSQADQVL